MNMNPVYIQQSTSIHADSTHTEGKSIDLPYLTACEPDYKSIITNATLRRRMSRIIKMGVACGLECISSTDSEKIQGIITATGLGCLADTEKFMNAILENEERMLNPTPFIQSTFNTIGAQIALFRGIHAYNMTYVHRGLSFESALLDALIQIWEGNDLILVGAMDEMTNVSYTIQQRLGMLKGTLAGEGAQFFLLSREANEHTLGEIGGVETLIGQHSYPEISERISAFLQRNGMDIQDVDQLVTGKNGNTHQDTIYQEVESNLFPQAVHRTFKDECGEYPTASSYAVWKVAKELKTATASTTVLIYNHYQSVNHSLILIRKRV